MKKKYKGTKSKRVSYAVCYIDNDNIPELILLEHNSGSTINYYKYAIFTYRKGKAKRIVYGQDSKPISYYNRRKLIVIERGGDPVQRIYATLSSKRLKTVAYTNYEDVSDYDDSYYTWVPYDSHDNTLSSWKFRSIINSYSKGTGAKGITYYLNTSSNRKYRLKA